MRMLPTPTARYLAACMAATFNEMDLAAPGRFDRTQPAAVPAGYARALAAQKTSKESPT